MSAVPTAGTPGWLPTGFKSGAASPEIGVRGIRSKRFSSSRLASFRLTDNVEKQGSELLMVVSLRR